MIPQNIAGLPYGIRPTLHLLHRELKDRPHLKKTDTAKADIAEAKTGEVKTVNVGMIKAADFTTPEATPKVSTPVTATPLATPYTQATADVSSTSSWTSSFDSTNTPGLATPLNLNKPLPILPFPSFEALGLLNEWIAVSTPHSFLQEGVYVVLKAAFAPRPPLIQGPMGEKMGVRVSPHRGHFRTSRHCQFELLQSLTGHYLNAVSAVEYLLSDLFPREDARDLLRQISDCESKVDMKELHKRLNAYFMPKAVNVMSE